MSTNYPSKLDAFSRKIDSKGEGFTTIINNEIFQIPSSTQTRVYLVHDNVIDTTIKVYTGANKSGSEVTDFQIGVDVDKPWRTWILFGTVGVSYAGTAYLFYETKGDTVEGDDINNLQSSVVAVQKELGVNPKGVAKDVAERIKLTEDRITTIENSGNATTTRAISFYVDGILAVEKNIISFIAPLKLEVLHVRLAVDIAPTGSNIVIDINRNGNTMYTAQADRPVIMDGTTSGSGVKPGDFTINEGDKVTLEVDQTGVSVPGENLSVTIVCNEIKTL